MMGDVGQAMFIVGVLALVGVAAFLIFGLPLLHKLGRTLGGLFLPADAGLRVRPEYSVAEARVKQGRYAEAVVEYRKVIERFPSDVYAHVQIADLAVAHLQDRSLAERELLAAQVKAVSDEALVLVAHRLADLYQHQFGAPARAVPVIEALRSRLKSPEQIHRIDQQLAVLRRRAGGATLAPTPTKIQVGQSRFRLDRDSHDRI